MFGHAVVVVMCLVVAYAGRTNRLSDQLVFQPVDGAATVYTFTVARQATAAPFADEVPQIITIVELDEGVRFTTNLVDVAPEDVRVGMRVAPVFDHGDDGMTLLRYRPA